MGSRFPYSATVVFNRISTRSTPTTCHARHKSLCPVKWWCVFFGSSSVSSIYLFGSLIVNLNVIFTKLLKGIGSCFFFLQKSKYCKKDVEKIILIRLNLFFSHMSPSLSHPKFPHFWVKKTMQQFAYNRSTLKWQEQTRIACIYSSIKMSAFDWIFLQKNNVHSHLGKIPLKNTPHRPLVAARTPESLF